MSLSQSEVYTLAKSEGLSDESAKIAAAIAMGESGGNPNAHNLNPSTGDDSYGLWQINMLGRLKGERLAQFGIKDPTELYNPKTNARAMRILSATGSKWSDWSVYKNGTYRQYLSNPVSDQSSQPGWLEKIGSAVAWPIGGLPGFGEIKDTASAAATIAQLAGKAAVWGSNPRNWVRVAYVVGGSVVVVAGLIMVTDSTKTGRALTQAATKVATRGKGASRSSTRKVT